MAPAEFVRKAATVKRAIERAFAGVAYPGDAALLHPRYRTAIVEVAAFHRKAWNGDWSRVPREVVQQNFSSLLFFSPEAFRFFLPAYVICALRPPADWQASKVLTFTLYCLNPEVEDARFVEHFLGQVEGLSAEQKEAVELFLELVREEHPDESLRQEAAHGLERYWASSRSPRYDLVCPSGD